MKQTGNILTGDRYPWKAEIVGDDIIVRGQHGTWFGGSDDPIDDGQTASGISTKSNPLFFGCSLPMDYTVGAMGNPNPPHNPCHGSPLPKLPWGTNVEVINRDNGKSGLCKLIDIGPSAPPEATAAIDLTQAFFTFLGQPKTAGTIHVDFRIIKGAKLACLFPVVANPEATNPVVVNESDSMSDKPSLIITPNFGPTMGV